MKLWERGVAVMLLVGTTAAMGESLTVGSTGDHVRVIIDTSRTMCGAACGWTKGPAQDPGRLAILSTILLHDLLKIDPDKADLRDSFGVIPFRDVPWTSGSPPVNDQTFRYSRGMKPSGRQQFLAELEAIPFDSWHTHYSSSIERALADLPGLAEIDHPATTRTIVLITDGLPNHPDLDASYIKDTLLPKLAQKQTRLYVLMFGSEATTKGKAFFQDIKQRDEDNVTNGLYPQHAFPNYYVEADGRRLPEKMIDLFGESFGYVHFPAKDRIDPAGAAEHRLDLDANVEAPEAVIVALRLDPQGLSSPQPPNQRLKPPPGGNLSSDLFSAVETGGSYSLRWESKPSKGDYLFSIENGTDESVFVLRPTNLTVDLRGHVEKNPNVKPPYPSCFPEGSLVTMADQTCTLDFLIRSGSGSAAGISGIPAILGVRYFLEQPNPSGGEAWHINDERGVAIGANDQFDHPPSAGRRYWSVTQFTKNQIDETKPYKAHAMVHVTLGTRMVAARLHKDPFEITVWPKLGLTPSPSLGAVKNQKTGTALKRGESDCTRFHLEEDYGTMLESAQGLQPGYDLRAFLQADQQVINGAALKDAVFTLKSADRQKGGSIGFAGVASQQSLTWASGQRLELEQIVHRNGVGGEFDLCVTLGPHADGDPQYPADLSVHFVLDEEPYGHFDVIKPFRAQVHVDRHPGLSPWSVLPFLLLLLGLLAALMLLRPRFALPKDLGYGLATMANPHRFQARRLPSASPWKLLFSRKAERVVTDRDGELLGWVRPEDDELYGLRPAPGVEVVDAGGKVLEPGRGGVTLLQVHQAYRLRHGSGDLMFRTEYL
jgi:hypothetical protein